MYGPGQDMPMLTAERLGDRPELSGNALEDLLMAQGRTRELIGVLTDRLVPVLRKGQTDGSRTTAPDLGRHIVAAVQTQQDLNNILAGLIEDIII